MIVPSYHFMIGPTAALLVLGVLVLICRWVFSTKDRDERTARRRAAARARADFGLLVPVASAPSVQEAESLRSLLRDAGVRGTVAPGGADGAVSVLVFRSDVERARALVG